MDTVCYLASPLGFAESTRGFMDRQLIPAISGLGIDVLNPWAEQYDMDSISKIGDFGQRAKAYAEMNRVIAENNLAMIDRADILVAVLDGVDVDSGTASEIGYAYAKGKSIYGYRGDFRLASDNVGCSVNLQVEHFCSSIAPDLESLRGALSGHQA